MSVILDDEILTEPTEVTHIWDDLGLTKDEKEHALKCMHEEIDQIKINYLNKLKERRDQIVENIERRRQTLFKIIRSVKKAENEEEEEDIESIASKGTLKEKIAELDKATQKYIKEYEKASEKFLSVKQQTDELFDKLGYSQEERGEFNEIGYEDLSNERLERFEDKRRELELEVSKRTELLSRNEEKIREILNELDEKMQPVIQEIFDTNNIKVGSFQAMEKYYDELQAIRHARSSKYYELALQLTNLWELFETPEEERHKFIQNHQKLSTKSLQECFDEIQKLSQHKIDELPNLIDRSLKRIDEACKFLHKTESEQEQLIQNAQRHNPSQLKYFENLDVLVQNLQREIVLSTPILKMIEQREEIIKSYKDFTQQEQEMKKVELSKENEIQLNIKADKAQRRYRFVLPRLEKKLLLSLIEYRHATNKDLTYDGEIYYNKLCSIPLSHDEIKKAKIGGRRQSLAVKRKSLEGLPEVRQRRKSEWPMAYRD